MSDFVNVLTLLFVDESRIQMGFSCMNASKYCRFNSIILFLNGLLASSMQLLHKWWLRIGFPHMGHGTMFCNSGSALLGAFLLVLETLAGTRRFGTARSTKSVTTGQSGQMEGGKCDGCHIIVFD